ncbi:hypothetical protein F5X99DRAFT_378470 [Biscogniauxia marginata]|nr:hypothetical protein F5X99DRAFT_378470 [Biscogniauxia marginata]
MSTTEESSKSSLALEFSRFSKLPIELRAQIWQHALDDATVSRTIHVAVHHWAQATQHSCLTLYDHFCGLHGHCNRYRSGEPSHVGYCMTDGYFAGTSRYPDPVDPASSSRLLGLSLACRESCDVIVSRYPKLMKVYRGQWRLGCERRLIRCNTETDLLVVTELPDYSHLHIDPSQPQDVIMQRHIDSLNLISHRMCISSLVLGKFSLRFDTWRLITWRTSSKTSSPAQISRFF